MFQRARGGRGWADKRAGAQQGHVAVAVLTAGELPCRSRGNGGVKGGIPWLLLCGELRGAKEQTRPGFHGAVPSLRLDLQRAGQTHTGAMMSGRKSAF